MYPARSLRVKPPEESVQCRRTPEGQLGQTLSKFGIPAGRRRQPVEQCSQVEASTPDQDRERSPICEVLQRLPGQTRVGASCEFLIRIKDIREMVWDAVLGFRRDLPRSNVEAPINLDRVAADDLSVKGLGEKHSEIALTSTRWSQYDNQW